MNHQLKEIIRSLIQKGEARTQQEICTALVKAGFTVNQTKVSRLLHKLGAIKVKDSEGQLVYQLVPEQIPLQKSTLISELVLEIKSNQNLIVILTQPGCASMVARLIDSNKKTLEILGSIAGDDTVFVAPDSSSPIDTIITQISALFAKD